ncbi:uncharacterized protein FIBRA_09309 [Fibroporia radiculosa]|uniref:Uncharacterized protein n=1 Tax=Fibroporia radiculosa TaxID=599839 RepID=J7RHD3_9APHY|nr:uncharacterized protein FIBRA_09309 [Fibroporia radiculosa]CCM06992.1 predicted protein [Fibroporia radiculosa]
MAAIHRLNEDIIYDIFSLLVASSFRSPLDSCHAFREGTTWFSITAVCRQWRHVAFSAPSLWKEIVLTRRTRRPLLELFLKRSRDIDLTVRIEGRVTTSGIESFVCLTSMVSLHSVRISSFSVEGMSPGKMVEVLAPFTNCAAGRMKTISLSARIYSTSTRLCDIPSLFANGTPSLRSVQMLDISVPWMFYAGLTEIVLKNQRLSSMNDLKRMLRRCPDLRILTFGLSNHTRILAPATDTSVVDLPQLTQLTLFGHHGPVAEILTQMAFPTTTRIGLAFVDHMISSSYIRYTDGCDALCDIIHSVNDATLDMLSLIDYRITISSSKANFAVQWEWSSRSVDDPRDSIYLAHIGDVVSFPTLRSLTITGSRLILSDRDWLNILGLVPSLMSLCLQNWSSDGAGIFEAVGHVIPMGSTHGHFSVCPSLSHLTVYENEDIPGLYDALPIILSVLCARKVHDAALTCAEFHVHPDSVGVLSQGLQGVVDQLVITQVAQPYDCEPI